MRVAQSARGGEFCNKRSIWFRKEEVIKRLARRACPPTSPRLSALSSPLLFLQRGSPVIAPFAFLPLRKKTRVNAPRRIGLCPESLRREHQSAKVFTVVSASSWQALDPRTQPHVIRTRPYDLLHYPVITHAASWRTRHGINNPWAQLVRGRGGFFKIKVKPKRFALMAAATFPPSHPKSGRWDECGMN